MDKKINGFTLVEMMFTGVIIIILCCVFLIPFSLSTQKSLKMQNNKIYAEQNARLTIGWIMSKVRSAENIVHERWIGNPQSKKIFIVLIMVLPVF
ncbi:MAG: type II secretion system protein [bacterium]